MSRAPCSYEADNDHDDDDDYAYADRIVMVGQGRDGSEAHAARKWTTTRCTTLPGCKRVLRLARVCKPA